MSWQLEFWNAQDDAIENGTSEDHAFNRVWCAREDGRIVSSGGETLGDPRMHIVKGWVIDGTHNKDWWARTPETAVQPLRPDNSFHGLIARYRLGKARQKYGPGATVVNMPIGNIWKMTLLVPSNKALEAGLKEAS